MPRLNVPPTKSNLLRLKRDLEFAREGFEMLDQKRRILVLELMATVEAAKRAQDAVVEKMRAAFAALGEALLKAGTLQVAGHAAGPRPEHAADVRTRSLMGVFLPTVTADHPSPGPRASLLSSSVTLDEATAAFHGALESIDRLAEVENAVFRLAREVRKAQRRVNALEKVFIPAYVSELAYIAGSLEEHERDERVIMRMVKQRGDQLRAGDRAAPAGG